MGLSETILAAMIGALATVATALFQLFSAIKQHRISSKVDTRPKKRSTMRSVLAVLALMVASAAGGFLYSEFMKQRSSEDMRAMRDELKEMRSMIAAERKATQAEASAPAQLAAMDHNAVTLPASMESVADSVESVVYIPACRASGATTPCSEQEAQRIALCGTIPSYARVDRIQLFAQPDAMQYPWDKHQAMIEQDLGGARFTGNSFEYAQGQDLKAVCVNFMQWSSEHPHIARIVVEFGFGNTPAPIEPAPMTAPVQMTPAQVPAVIAADSSHAVATQAAFTTTGAAQ
jgi:hypothetical protein